MDEIGTYGQFGQAVYDHDEQCWHFQRSTDTGNVFKSLGEPRTIVGTGDEPIYTGFSNDGDERPTRRRENQVKALVKLHPKIQPANLMLPDLARVSEAVEEATAQHDPLKGNLLAFGSVYDESARRQAEVVAIPTGPTGSDLRLFKVRKQRRGWQGIQSIYLQVPTIHGEENVWKGPGVPLQSLVFANPIEGSENYLAVRLITEVLIFRPALRKEPIRGGSHLDANLLLRLDMGEISNQPFADVVFNPWYSRQIALLDQGGFCTVVELPTRNPLKAKRVAANSPTDEHENNGKTPLNDCWGRVSWVSGPSMLAICTGRDLKIFEIANEGLVERHAPDAILSDIGLILDMSVPLGRTKELMLLTSQHIFVYHVDHGVVTRIAQIRHFLSGDDISLRSDCFSEGNVIFAFVHSAFNSSIMIIRLRLTDEGQVQVFDPVALEMSTPDLVDRHRLDPMHLHSINVKGDLSNIATGLERGGRADNLRFFQLTTLHKDSSVQQTLYVTGNTSPPLGPPKWEKKFAKSADELSNKPFIIDDDEGVEEADEADAVSAPVSNFVKRMTTPQVFNSRDWTVNYEHTVRLLNDVDVTDVTSIDEALEVVQSAVGDGSNDDNLPLRTLKDLIEGEITLRDVEIATTELGKLLLKHAGTATKMTHPDSPESNEERTASIWQSIKAPVSLKLLEIDSNDPLRIIYESLARSWTRPDADGISDFAQQSQDQLALRMAAEVALSSIVIRPQQSEAEPQPESQTESKGQIWELPVRPGAQLSARSTPSVYLDAPSQPVSPRSPRLPTPSETGSSSSAPRTNAALERLSKYTTFNSSPKARPTPLSRRLHRVLSHWTVGEDPAIYDWTTTSRHVSRREAEEEQDEEMTEKERERQRRRTERFVRRQQREVEEAARMQAASSQGPMVITASQPAIDAVTGAGDSQSQSQRQGRPAASQVLPGRHGGRPAKKKRKQGF